MDRVMPQERDQITRRPAATALDVAVVIVSWNVRHYLAECLRSVFAELQRARLHGEVWVVDNASTDGTPAFVSDLFPNVNLIVNSSNYGFGAANNQGMWDALRHSPRYFLLLNPDTLVRPGAIGSMVRWLDGHPRVGMAGARLVYADGRLQHSAFAFPGLRQLLFEFLPLPARWYDTWLNGRYALRRYARNRPFAIDHPLGAAMLVRRNVVEATNGFDEAFHMYCEEIDWAWRIRRAGWQIFAVPAAEIVHYVGESTRQIPARSVINLWRSRALLYRKYYAPWKIRIAARIVRAGLRRRAAQAATPELAHAYRDAADAWN